LQPFIVTLCGLFIYRGLAQLAPVLSFPALGARLLSIVTFGLYESNMPVLVGSSRDVGIGGRPDLQDLRFFAAGEVYGIPMMFAMMCVVAIFAGVLLHLTVYGRYLYAVGYNTGRPICRHSHRPL
jgi:ribose transport system permease protein